MDQYCWTNRDDGEADTKKDKNSDTSRKEETPQDRDVEQERIIDPPYEGEGELPPKDYLV
ncbi:MAG: hypothetical protein WAO98_06715 [Alphaproteobacteria bacterium]